MGMSLCADVFFFKYIYFYIFIYYVLLHACTFLICCVIQLWGSGESHTHTPANGMRHSDHIISPFFSVLFKETRWVSSASALSDDSESVRYTKYISICILKKSFGVFKLAAGWNFLTESLLCDKRNTCEMNPMVFPQGIPVIVAAVFQWLAPWCFPPPGLRQHRNYSSPTSCLPTILRGPLNLRSSCSLILDLCKSKLVNAFLKGPILNKICSIVH